MIRFDLDDEEALELLTVLEEYLGDLRMEVADTDSMDYREMLKGREVIIKNMIAKLKAAR
jgi:hypothetical protein